MASGKRLEGESYEAYKQRLKALRKVEKERARGWIYVKPEEEKKKDERKPDTE